jgi:hypothetical protein
MIKLIALTDYKDRFGSKHFDEPYRSGMDKERLISVFNSFEIELCFIPMHKAWELFPSDADFFIYTSSEDDAYLYKSYIEDVVLGLVQMGKVALPGFIHLRANNNKVFMEFLRGQTKNPLLNTIKTSFYGTLEELKKEMHHFSFPVVLKKSAGASGRGVFKANNENELVAVGKIASQSRSLKVEIRDWLRSFKHKGYVLDSAHRNKFVVQNFIPDLKNDWKVYWFNGDVYIFYRPIFSHRDFIASGGGYDNYLYGEDAFKPQGFFDFVEEVISCFDVPQASMDIAFDGKDFHLLEIQFLYFGTAGIPYSKGFYKKESGDWIYVSERHDIEYVYAKSIASYIHHEA